MDVTGGLVNRLNLDGDTRVRVTEDMDLKSGQIDWLDLGIGKAKISLQGGTLAGANTRSGELELDIGIDLTVGKTDISITVTGDQITIWNQKTGNVIFTDFPEGYKGYMQADLDEIMRNTMAYWRPVVPRIIRVLRDMSHQREFSRNPDYNAETMERILSYLAEEHDPPKLYGKRLRELIEKGYDEGRIP